MKTQAALVCIAGVLGLGCATAQEINTATRAELEQLNGIGVTMADRVLAERERAPFTSWADLERRVKGIKGARADRLQSQGVTVNGERERRPEKRDEHQ